MATTATSATATPARARVDGRSPVAKPHPSGTAAATSAVVGATTLIRPMASPR